MFTLYLILPSSAFLDDLDGLYVFLWEACA